MNFSSDFLTSEGVCNSSTAMLSLFYENRRVVRTEAALGSSPEDLEQLRRLRRRRGIGIVRWREATTAPSPRDSDRRRRNSLVTELASMREGVNSRISHRYELENSSECLRVAVLHQEISVRYLKHQLKGEIS